MSHVQHEQGDVSGAPFRLGYLPNAPPGFERSLDAHPASECLTNAPPGLERSLDAHPELVRPLDNPLELGRLPNAPPGLERLPDAPPGLVRHHEFNCSPWKTAWCGSLPTATARNATHSNKNGKYKNFPNELPPKMGFKTTADVGRWA